MVRKKRLVILAAIIGSVFASLFIIFPVAMAFVGFYYTSSRVQSVLDNVSESELLERAGALPEVKAYVEKYPNVIPYINTDFHVGVTYEKQRVYLDVVFSPDTQYPAHTIFSCRGSTLDKYPLSDPILMTAIKNC
jgi:hypothetical protein